MDEDKLKHALIEKTLENLRISGGEIDTSSSREESKPSIYEDSSYSKFWEKPEIKETKMQMILKLRKE
jgi:hypothetical protein